MNGPDRTAFTAGYDEDRDHSGAPRGSYAQALEALGATDLDELSRTVARALDRHGVAFGADPFVVDPVPRMIDGAEWDALAAGLAQRARALNAFLLDAYGERRIVREGVIDEDVIKQAEGYEPELLGRLAQRGSPAAVIGFDVVRDPDGAFLVLEDNLRTPSGFAYALAAREALAEVLPAGFPAPRPVDPVTYDLLGAALRGAAPEGCAEPFVAILTDGSDNVAYYEHAQAARRLGAALVTLDELVRDPGGDTLSARLPDGGLRPVDVVYRRTNEDRIHGDDGALTDVAEVLLEPWLRGAIGLVNAYGNGLADDKFFHGCVEDCVRFYLGEEPLVRSVPTKAIDCGPDGAPTIADLRKLVVKPRHGHGGIGVVIGAHAETHDLHRLVAELATHPERYICQPIIALSRHPTVIDGRLEPRHIDLRAFAFAGADGKVALIPGGLTRVALDPGALVVNSSQKGGGKDTWVVD